MLYVFLFSISAYIQRSLLLYSLTVYINLLIGERLERGQLSRKEALPPPITARA
jgi:hypothetical protein